MASASNLDEFKSAVQQMQMPMFTFMYADKDGNIMHHFGGRTPVRSQGDFMTWRGPVPGDSSEWLWTDTHPFEDLPTAINPESGWLQNANDPPWTTTFPEAFDADEFPAYMAPRFMHARAQRSAEMLANDDSLTFEEAVAYKLSNRVGLADRILDDLAAAVDAHGDSEAKAAMAVLEAWDRTVDTDSRGGVLFKAFFLQMISRGQGLATPLASEGFAMQWDEDQPRTTPDGLADPQQAAAALSAAAVKVREAHGSLDVPWGDVHRLKQGERNLPANGATGGMGLFRVVSFDQGGRAIGGDSWVAITEFSDPVRAKVLLSYGNSSQPGSPHNGDQLELFSRKELRDAWLQRAEVEANLESRATLQRDQ
jgi:acyl-homoserine-lactone acylase